MTLEQKQSASRFFWALLTLIFIAMHITALVFILLDFARTKDAAEPTIDSRAAPLQRAISTQLSILGEPAHYTGNTCSRTIAEDTDTSDTPFTCLITTESGQQFEVEITLIKMAGNWYELPAVLTPITGETL